MSRTGFGRSPALVRAVAGGALAGSAVLGYSLWEATRFVLRRVDLPVLPPDARPLRVLHLSDIHLTPGQAPKIAWLRGLRDLAPDLVIDTGDNIAHRDAVPVLLDALGPMLEVPGVFVFGSNDYYSPTLRNPLKYLLPDDGRRRTDVPQLPWRDLRDRLTEYGWLDLTNTRGRLEVGDIDLAFAGVDDPHLRYDDLAAVSAPAPAEADVRLAVAHAPYLRVLDTFARGGWDAVIAGHTHGGQVCLPGVGALTTNCDLDRARAKGRHRHPADSAPGDPDSTWLHVSAGLGTSPFTPVRLACRPEATLLTLTHRPG